MNALFRSSVVRRTIFSHTRSCKTLMKTHRPKLQNPTAPSVLRRHAEFNRKATELQQSRKALPVSIIGGVLFLFASFLIGYRSYPRRFTEGPLYSTTARIKSVFFSGGTKFMSDVGHVTFRLRDEDVVADTLDYQKLAGSHVGDVVPVTYRIDKNGFYHIDDWQPSSPSSK